MPATLWRGVKIMAIEDYYHEISVQKNTSSVDAYGDTTHELGEKRSVMGYIGRPNMSEAKLAAQMGVQIVGRLYTTLEAGIKAFDVITDDDGTVFQVKSAPRDAARRGHHVEADLIAWRW